VTPGHAFIGISGYDYKGWRGRFYPDDLPARRWLEYASQRFNSIELNGTFYSLKAPPVFERWIAEVPEGDFVFAIKGGRFITHNLKLKNAEASLGNFYASGVLALGSKTGPFLWQLPATYRFDAERLDGFMRLLPRSASEAEGVARSRCVIRATSTRSSSTCFAHTAWRSSLRTPLASSRIPRN
jgi:uncharacterized protein YecE (DUF72 family)